MLVEKQADNALYECGSCGSELNHSLYESNLCPDCERSASKVADQTRPHCGGPVDGIKVYQCDPCERSMSRRQPEGCRTLSGFRV